MRLHTHIGYLEKHLAKGKIDFLDQTNMADVQQYMLLTHLFFDGIKEVHLADDDSVIENSNIPFVTHFIKEGRLKPKQASKTAAAKTFDLHFDDNIQEAEVKIAEKKSGCFYANATTDTEAIFGEYIQHFERTIPHNWDFAAPLFEPHNSVVVVDPYLFTHAGLNGLAAMFRKIVPLQLEQTYHITLVGKPRPQQQPNRPPVVSNILKINEIESHIVLLAQDLRSRGLTVDLELFYCKQPDMHDRYIFTNNMGAFLGSGLGIIAGDVRTPFHEGSWVVYRPYKRISFNGKPGIFFYEVMQRKLKVIKQWICASGYLHIINPLFLK